MNDIGDILEVQSSRHDHLLQMLLIRNDAFRKMSIELNNVEITDALEEKSCR